MDQRPQKKIRYTESDRRGSRDSLERICTRKDFLNRTPLAQALRSAIDKWDLKKLNRFCKAMCSYLDKAAAALENSKRFLPPLHAIED